MVDRVEEMNPQWIHPMHGGSVPQDAAHYYFFHALRNEPFVFEGKPLWRMLPGFSGVEEG